MARNLAAESSAPLYKEVEREIMQSLARGEWKPGDRLPSEPELAERFGVAVFTIRAGIQKLVEAGIVLRRQGKGTYVTLHRARPLRNQFLRIFTRDGVQASWTREFISIRKGRADDSAARVLKLGPAAADRAVYEVLFLLKNEGKTMAFVESTLSAAIFGNVGAADLEDTRDNLYAVFQERFDVNVIRIEERVHAVRAGTAGARWLSIDASEPVLRLERVAYTYNDVPVEFRRYNVEAAHYHYYAPLNT